LIGIIGGTFNPIHYGHLLMCEQIREEFGLEKVLFIPSKIPPHKMSQEIAATEHRLEMVRLAIQDNPYFELSDVEMKMPGPSYTVETLRVLMKEYGRNRLYFIIGADSLVQLTTWMRFDEILGMVDLIVARRPDTDNNLLEQEVRRMTSEYNARIHVSEAVALDFSSTRIRNRVRKGLSIKYMVPDCVEKYILEHGLYAG
jgi:nicotinate (nicotinamide) nucleotide adenylyltransferase